MRRFLLAAAALGALGGYARAEELRLKPGQSAAFTLPENPSTGYSWRLDAEQSEGMGLVSVSDGGHAPGRPLPGAPGTRHWTIRALAPGKAALVFAYQRPWEATPVETRRLDIRVSAQKGK